MPEALSSPLEFALTYAREGFAVFPCKPRSKKPITKHGFKEATCDEAQIRNWWTRWPDANIGIATGAVSGLIVVDIDSFEGAELLANLARRFGLLTPTRSVVTGKGRHFYFKLPRGCGTVPCTAEGGLDIRADGGYVVAPPSMHPHGNAYQWDAALPDEMALAPDWLLDFARNRKSTVGALGRPRTADGSAEGNEQPRFGEGRPEPRQDSRTNDCANVHAPEPWSERAKARLRSALAVIPAFDRDIWLKIGFALHDLTKHDARWAGRDIWDKWSAASAEKFNHADQDKTWASFDRGYDGVRVTVATIYQLAYENGWIDAASAFAPADDEAPLLTRGVDFSRRLRTDAGNALAFLDLFGENLRFIEKWGSWIVWEAGRWREASDVALLPLARRATEEMQYWAGPMADDERSAWRKHALSSQRDARLRAMINLAKGEARGRIEPDVLDADPWLLGCPNGTLDLRPGKLREARRDDFITKQIGVAFDPTATCPRFREFLDWATHGDRELASFLQKLAGYALTGEVREEVMCALVGDGANGKSTFLMALFELFGDYAGKARSDLLVHAQGKEGAPSPDIAALHGKRLVIVSETEDGCSLSEARIKDIVSNETIAARRLHRDPFTFRPIHKIILATNHKPHVRGTDNGIWRRLAIVPFSATVAEEAKAADFRERLLRPELAGILNWAVEGLMNWRREGLRLPKSVREASAEYRSEMDTVAQWIEERTEASPNAVISIRTLHDDYIEWLGKTARPFGSRRFSEELERKGYAACKLTGGARARRGLRLKPPGATSRFAVVR